jgi:hypothetical protein
VITLEDPVEYRLEGLTQVQVHKRAGLGFASALRAVLRQDPDVIMVGELRDKETVETAMAAAMTGHLVLSTVHTNDAPSAATRLAEMGAASYLVAAGLIGVLAQRLVRRLCPHCAIERQPKRLERATLALPLETLRDAGGCHRCEATGYRGRLGVFELLVVDSRIRELLAKRAPVDVLREVAVAAGMDTLAVDASRKVRNGETTWTEVRPLLGLGAAGESRCPQCGAALRAAFRACVECGERVRRSCACGTVLDARWRHCPRCGQRAGETADVTQKSGEDYSSPVGNGAGATGTAEAAGASLRAEA